MRHRLLAMYLWLGWNEWQGCIALVTRFWWSRHLVLDRLIQTSLMSRESIWGVPPRPPSKSSQISSSPGRYQWLHRDPPFRSREPQYCVISEDRGPFGGNCPDNDHLMANATLGSSWFLSWGSTSWFLQPTLQVLAELCGENTNAHWSSANDDYAFGGCHLCASFGH